MAINKELVALQSAHDLYLQRLAVQYGNEAGPYIDKMSEQISTRINREVGKSLTANRREKLLSDIDDIITEQLGAYTKELKANNADAGKYAADWQSKTIAGLYPTAEAVTVTKAAINGQARNTLIKLGEGSYTSYNRMLSNYVSDNAEQITNIVANGFVSGTTNRQIAAEILAEVDNRVVKTRKQAMGIARSGTNHYANQARKVQFDADPIVIGTRRLATLDSRTSQYCRGIDNTVVLKTDPNYRSAFAPFHPNCRTSNSPEVNAKYKHEDDGGTRPSNFRDGDMNRDPKDVSSTVTFYETFKNLDATAQDRQLGKSLGKAFRKGLREGTLTPESFAKMTIDEKNLKPLTLAEMKQKDNELARLLKEQEG